MSAARSHLNLKLLPELAAKFPRYASAFDLPPSTVLGILVWNDSINPDRTLEALAPSPRLNRIGIGCSLRAARRRVALQRSREQKLSLNAYLEALIASHLARSRGALVILNPDRK